MRFVLYLVSVNAFFRRSSSSITWILTYIRMQIRVMKYYF